MHLISRSHEICQDLVAILVEFYGRIRIGTRRGAEIHVNRVVRITDILDSHHPFVPHMQILPRDKNRYSTITPRRHPVDPVEPGQDPHYLRFEQSFLPLVASRRLDGKSRIGPFDREPDSVVGEDQPGAGDHIAVEKIRSDVIRLRAADEILAYERPLQRVIAVERLADVPSVSDTFHPDIHRVSGQILLPGAFLRLVTFLGPQESRGKKGERIDIFLVGGLQFLFPAVFRDHFHFVIAYPEGPGAGLPHF